MEYLRSKRLHDKAIEELEPILKEWWYTAVDELPAGESFWVGDDLFYHMAEAAAAVLLAQGDVQEYLKREGHMKDE